MEPAAGGSWVMRGLYIAPVVFTIAYTHRRSLARFWGGEDEKARGGGQLTRQPAATLPAPPLRGSDVVKERADEEQEEEEREEEERKDDLHNIQQKVVRLARNGDVEGLLALLDSVLDAEGMHLNFIFSAAPTVGCQQAEEEDLLSDGCSPLFVAALHGHAPVVSLLLERGADPTSRSTPSGVLPLYVACLEGYHEVVEALLSSGVNVNDVGVKADGSTALMACCEGGHVGLVRLLLTNGADIEARGRNGQTALFYATQMGHEHVVQLLAVEYACNVNARKKDGATPLFLAVISGRVDIVRLLLEAHADPHAQSNTGDTPARMASKLRSLFPDVYAELMRCATFSTEHTEGEENDESAEEVVSASSP